MTIISTLAEKSMDGYGGYGIYAVLRVRLDAEALHLLMTRMERDGRRANDDNVIRLLEELLSDAEAQRAAVRAIMGDDDGKNKAGVARGLRPTGRERLQKGARRGWRVLPHEHQASCNGSAVGEAPGGGRDAWRNGDR